jgi:hypothetical protein
MHFDKFYDTLKHNAENVIELSRGREEGIFGFLPVSASHTSVQGGSGTLSYGPIVSGDNRL